jgi:hypothetical protein
MVDLRRTDVILLVGRLVGGIRENRGGVRVIGLVICVEMRCGYRDKDAEIKLINRFRIHLLVIVIIIAQGEYLHEKVIENMGSELCLYHLMNYHGRKL